MMSLDLNAARIFVEVVTAGSFTEAAKRLEMPASTVSDRIAALEKALGVSLLTRTTRSLRLTDTGEEYFNKSAPAVRQLVDAFDETYGAQAQPSGTLRLACPAEFASREIAEAVVEYRKRFPQMNVEILIANDLVHFHRDRVDIAIRGGHLKDSSLKAKRLGLGRLILAASPKYLRQSARITGPADLRAHSCLGFLSSDKAGSETVWNLQTASGLKAKAKPRITTSTNSFGAMEELMKAHEGIGFVPENLIREAISRGKVTQVLSDWSSGPIPVHLVFPAHRTQLAKIREIIPLLTMKVSPLLSSEP